MSEKPYTPSAELLAQVIDTNATGIIIIDNKKIYYPGING